jgi:hypothetical protein
MQLEPHHLLGIGEENVGDRNIRHHDAGGRQQRETLIRAVVRIAASAAIQPPTA